MASRIRRDRVSRNRRFLLETLERRALLCDVTASVTNGVLEVSGGQFDDSIALVYNQARQSIEVHGEGHAVTTFPASAVQSLRIQGLDGNDRISLDPVLDLPTRIDGGTGTDTVVGLSGVDPIVRQDGTIDFQSERSFCVDVECFQDSTNVSSLTVATPAAAQRDSLADHNAMTGVLSSVHERPARVARAAAGLRLPTLAATGSTNHSTHAQITQLIESSLESSSLSAHHRSDQLSNLGGFLDDQPDTESPVPAQKPFMGDNDSSEHSVGGHSLGSLTAETRVAAASPEFAMRSPYKTECPTSSPVGAPAVASSASPATVGGEIANTVSGAPKLGCKCLAMQRAAKNSNAAQERPAAGTSAAALIVAQYEATPAPKKARLSCCQDAANDGAIESLQIEFTSQSDQTADSPPRDPQADGAVQPAHPDNADEAVHGPPGSASMEPWQRLTVVAGVALFGVALHTYERKRGAHHALADLLQLPRRSALPNHR